MATIFQKLSVLQQVHQSTVAKAKDAKGHGSEKRGMTASSESGGSDHWHYDSRQDDAAKEARGEKGPWSPSKLTDDPDDERHTVKHEDGSTGQVFASKEAAQANADVRNAGGKIGKTFSPNLRMLGTIGERIGKAGKGWFHGNQKVPGSKSARSDAYVSKMQEAKAHAKAGRMVDSKMAQADAQEQWSKMAPGERQYAMSTISDNASDDIGKALNRGFEFGHGRKKR